MIETEMLSVTGVIDTKKVRAWGSRSESTSPQRLSPWCPTLLGAVTWFLQFENHHSGHFNALFPGISLDAEWD